MELGKLSVEQFKGLGFVVVTLTNRHTAKEDTDRNETIIGLFGGILPITKTDTILVSPDDMYICVIKDGAINFLSSLFYNVKNIHIGDLKEYGLDMAPVTVIANFTEKDQGDAMSIMKRIYEAMCTEGRITEHDIIDDSKYTGITDEINSMVRASNPPERRTQTYNHVRSGGLNYNTVNPTVSYGTATTYKAKVVNTTVLVRDKKADPKEILAMEQKIQAIKDGTYIPPQLPTIPADTVKTGKEEEEKKHTHRKTGFR